MKVLISRGYGAGWSTWNEGEVAKLMRTYEPIIKAFENGEKLSENHPAVESLVKECKERFNEDYVCLSGLDGLSVEEVTPPFRIHECDGEERIITPNQDDNWIMQ